MQVVYNSEGPIGFDSLLCRQVIQKVTEDAKNKSESQFNAEGEPIDLNAREVHDLLENEVKFRRKLATYNFWMSVLRWEYTLSEDQLKSALSFDYEDYENRSVKYFVELFEQGTTGYQKAAISKAPDLIKNYLK